MTPRTIVLKTQGAECPITVGLSLESEVLAAIKSAAPETVVIIADSTTAQLWGDKVLSLIQKLGIPAEIFSFAEGEGNKHQETVTSLQHSLLEKRYGRNSLIIALGGGVVGDVAGYVAATYLRGVPYIQMPTTLLAMVDSSVGGKVGIDTPFGKNTVGAFYLPHAVISDLQFLSKLPREHVVNGLIEAIKEFLTSDAVGLEVVKKINLDDPLSTKEALMNVVCRSIEIKVGVAMRDEREQNERRILNFGHTIGHAIELLSGYTIRHGYAVAYGILVESKISELLGILSPEDKTFVAEYLSHFDITAEPIKKFQVSDIIAATKGDKKVRGGLVQYVLLEKIGSVYQKDGQFAHPVEDTVVEKTLESLR
ncbi:3-dehydroquinate synthase [Candidatus Kaiserbacteria bacterium RIFCSPHIGHO2_01_FULL_53_29]|uniref:3-dehydroquinate synthase n=1 Tax=Candidatus Kaiserbacteria bacterium RIFCSPHIGHO2_01_FULL_53_29 TaxID=1798480 RepID=A0A1F6CW40_9BACT|nr:MAG: 3-dehydroquinate synthase [Candidatus Kaiserbacteria bacterium RIFCSPHIGHO2_01_FULL_53_29]